MTKTQLASWSAGATGIARGAIISAGIVVLSGVASGHQDRRALIDLNTFIRTSIVSMPATVANCY